MSTLPMGRHAKRTHQGLMPEFYDSAQFVYPDPTSIQIICSYTDDNTGTNIVNAIIEIVYTDDTQVALASVRRLL